MSNKAKLSDMPRKRIAELAAYFDTQQKYIEENDDTIKSYFISALDNSTKLAISQKNPRSYDEAVRYAKEH